MSYAADLVQIEQRRRELRIERTELERLSELGVSYYVKLLHGRKQPTARTIAKLQLGIERAVRRQTEAGEMGMLRNVAYRALLALVAVSMGRDPAVAQMQDPALRANFSAEWRAYAEVRQLAIYLANCGAGWSQAATARAAGVTRQTVQQTAQAIEERRSDTAFDAFVARLEEAIKGVV